MPLSTLTALRIKNTLFFLYGVVTPYVSVLFAQVKEIESLLIFTPKA